MIPKIKHPTSFRFFPATIGAVYPLFLLLCLMLTATSSSAQIRKQFNYQGIAKNNSGPVNGDHTIEIKLSNSSGVVVYTETQTANFGSDGRFNITVGEPSGLPSSVDFSIPLTLTLSIDSVVTGSSPILSTPTAILSSTVIDGAITGSKLAEKAVSAGNLNATGASGALVFDGTQLSWQAIGSGGGTSTYPISGSVVPFADDGSSDINSHPGYTYLGPANTYGDQWSSLTPSGLKPFFNSAFAQVGTTLYVLGQSQQDVASYTSQVQKISLPSTAATLGSDLPAALGASAVAVWKNNIYMLGGAIAPTGANTIVPTVYIYDTKANTTRTGTSTGWIGRAYAAAATIGDSIWVLGGFDGTADVATINIYNPSTESWSTQAKGLGVAVDGAYYGSDGRYIYVLGGATRTSNKVSSAIQIIDAVTGSVTVQPNAFPASCFGASVTLHGKIYMFGGVDSTNTNLNRVLIYDMASHTLTTGSGFTRARQLPAVGVLGPTFYMFGGFDGGITTYSDGQSYLRPLTVNWFLKN